MRVHHPGHADTGRKHRRCLPLPNASALGWSYRSRAQPRQAHVDGAGRAGRLSRVARGAAGSIRARLRRRQRHRQQGQPRALSIARSPPDQVAGQERPNFNISTFKGSNHEKTSSHPCPGNRAFQRRAGVRRYIPVIDGANLAQATIQQVMAWARKANTSE